MSTVDGLLRYHKLCLCAQDFAEKVLPTSSRTESSREPGVNLMIMAQIGSDLAKDKPLCRILCTLNCQPGSFFDCRTLGRLCASLSSCGCAVSL